MRPEMAGKAPGAPVSDHFRFPFLFVALFYNFFNALVGALLMFL